MSEQLPPESPRSAAPMSDDFKARMRQGLSSMAVRERLRQRRRNRAIASGALAAIVVATAAVFGVQALSGNPLGQDRADPGTTVTPVPPVPTPVPTEPEPTTPPTAPPGFEGVAAGEPQVLDVESCTDGCGDAAAGGGGTPERLFDVYLLCEGNGSVAYGGEQWVDCSEHPAGSAFLQLDAVDTIDDGDPEFTTSADFDGQLRVVDPGRSPAGDAGGSTATVYVTCGFAGGTIRVGGVFFDCASVEAPAGEFLRLATIAAWGVPIEAGELAPRIERTDDSGGLSVSYVVER